MEPEIACRSPRRGHWQLDLDCYHGSMQRAAPRNENYGGMLMSRRAQRFSFLMKLARILVAVALLSSLGVPGNFFSCRLPPSRSTLTCGQDLPKRSRLKGSCIYPRQSSRSPALAYQCCGWTWQLTQVGRTRMGCLRGSNCTSLRKLAVVVTPSCDLNTATFSAPAAIRTGYHRIENEARASSSDTT